MLDYEVLKQKEKLLDNACSVLKKEFVGLNEIIDGIIYNVKPWFLFPELQNRPHVVCLWGLTGTGKTSLVKRLCQLLEIEKDMVYFNFAEIGECSSWDIESKIEEELSSERSNRVFVYDEFQYAATLDATGAEKDRKSGLKPFWELLDDGKLHRRDSFWRVRTLYKVVGYMQKINAFCPIKLEHGVWVNSQECMSYFTQYDIAMFSQVFNFDTNNGKTVHGLPQNGPVANEDYDDDDCCRDEVATQSSASGQLASIIGDKKGDGSRHFFLKDHYLDTLIELYDKTKSTVSDKLTIFHKIREYSFEQLLGLITEVFDSATKGYDLNFSDSIIFVIGNLDEAYTIAFNADPDMSPDQFNKVTKKITIVDVKEALQKRFRNEQIARLGNIHMIYPAFSSKSFMEIINLSLAKYAKDVKELTGYDVIFKDSIVKFIYNESVFPTHGTRPIYSSIHEIVKAKLPLVMREVYDKEDDIKKIEFSHKGRKTIIEIYSNSNELIQTLKYTEKTRLDKLRESECDEEQAIVAVHESGHFAVYAALMHKIPEKLCSKTASSNNGGFLMQDFDDTHKLHSVDMLLNRIKISLGGYCAEKMVFGDDYMSVGASSDLRSATRTASQLVRDYGYCAPYVTTYSENAEINDFGHMIRPESREEANAEIIDIIKICENDVNNILKSDCWRTLLKDSSEYLSVNSNMPKKKMQELYDKVASTCKADKKGSEYYRNKIKEI